MAPESRLASLKALPTESSRCGGAGPQQGPRLLHVGEPESDDEAPSDDSAAVASAKARGLHAVSVAAAETAAVDAAQELEQEGSQKRARGHATCTQQEAAAACSVDGGTASELDTATENEPGKDWEHSPSMHGEEILELTPADFNTAHESGGAEAAQVATSPRTSLPSPMVAPDTVPARALDKDVASAVEAAVEAAEAALTEAGKTDARAEAAAAVAVGLPLMPVLSVDPSPLSAVALSEAKASAAANASAMAVAQEASLLFDAFVKAEARRAAPLSNEVIALVEGQSILKVQHEKESRRALDREKMKQTAHDTEKQRAEEEVKIKAMVRRANELEAIAPCFTPHPGLAGQALGHPKLEDVDMSACCAPDAAGRGAETDDQGQGGTEEVAIDSRGQVEAAVRESEAGAPRPMTAATATGFDKHGDAESLWHEAGAPMQNPAPGSPRDQGREQEGQESTGSDWRRMGIKTGVEQGCMMRARQASEAAVAHEAAATASALKLGVFHNGAVVSATRCTRGARLWCDRISQVRKVPANVEGALMFQLPCCLFGPISLDSASPVEVVLFFAAPPRDGGLPQRLVEQGWSQQTLWEVLLPPSAPNAGAWF